MPLFALLVDDGNKHERHHHPHQYQHHHRMFEKLANDYLTKAYAEFSTINHVKGNFKHGAFAECTLGGKFDDSS